MSEPLRREPLAAWLGERTGIVLDPARLAIRRPGGGGWSNDTLFIAPATTAPPLAVLRMQPDGPAMFPDYALAREYHLLQWLAAHTPLPLAGLLGADLDGALLGRPFIATRFVAGQVPADDRPSFVEAGFLFDAPAATQRRFHLGMLDALATLHATPADCATGLFGRPPTLAAAIDELARIHHFDRGERFPPRLDAALAQLRATTPDSGPPVVLWGDARPANVIVAADGCTLRALLDWEMAAAGPAELDVAWLLEMNWMRAEGANKAPLPGFPDDAGSIAHYESRRHVRLQAMPWYRAFSAVKMAVLMHRFLRVSVQRGQLPADHRLLGETVATRRVDALLAAS